MSTTVETQEEAFARIDALDYSFEAQGPGRKKVLWLLARGEFDGVKFTQLDRAIRVGDTYLAGRYTGPYLLTAAAVHAEWIKAEEVAYPFDRGECYPIELSL